MTTTNTPTQSREERPCHEMTPTGSSPWSVRPSSVAGAAGGATHLVVVPVGDFSGDLLKGAGSSGILHVELGPVVIVVELKRGWVGVWAAAPAELEHGQLPEGACTPHPSLPDHPNLPKKGSETKPGCLGPSHLDGSERDAAKVLDGAQQPRLIVFLPVRNLRKNWPSVRAQTGLATAQAA